MLRVVERTERILDSDWLEDRNALSFLESIRPELLRDHRRLYYRVFEVFSRETVVPDATILCLDHGFMLEIVNMVRTLDAQLPSLADALLQVADNSYVMYYTRNEGEECTHMGFCCETVNYRLVNPKPLPPTGDFCGDLSSLFHSEQEFLSLIQLLYGQSSIYSIAATGGRIMTWGAGKHQLTTAISRQGRRWIVGKWFSIKGTVATLSRTKFATLMACIQSALPKGDELIYTYHQYPGGSEALWLLEHGWLPDSYVYGRTLKPKCGDKNAD